MNSRYTLQSNKSTHYEYKIHVQQYQVLTQKELGLTAGHVCFLCSLRSGYIVADGASPEKTTCVVPFWPTLHWPTSVVVAES